LGAWGEKSSGGFEYAAGKIRGRGHPWKTEKENIVAKQSLERVMKGSGTFSRSRGQIRKTKRIFPTRPGGVPWHGKTKGTA